MITENRILWLPGEEQRFQWDYDGAMTNSAGVRITPDNALAVSTVFACIRVLAETVAGLPLFLLERLETGGKRQARELPLFKKLHQQPNSWQTSFEWRSQMMVHLGLYNIAYNEIIPGPSGAVDQLVPLHPSRMKQERVSDGTIRYRYREDKGTETIYRQDQIFTIRGLSEDGINGVSPVEQCREAIALARACEIHGSRFFAAGARPGFILSTDGQLNAEARESLRTQWDRRHGGVQNSHTTAVLTGGLKPYELPAMTNTDSQFLELRRFQIEEICRIWRVPMAKVMATAGQTFGSLEQTSQDFLTDTIVPWLQRFEAAIMRDLIADDDRYEVFFDTRGVLRADAAARTAMHTGLWGIGVLSTNDIRDAEGLDPVEGGDVRYRPLNMGTLGQDPTATDVANQQLPYSGIDGQAVEGVAAEAANAAETGLPVSATSLDGKQLSSLMEIVTHYNSGLLNENGAKALIAAAFPAIPQTVIDAIIVGTSDKPVDVQPAPAAVARSAESRSQTISIDFDRTFAADPKLWGTFAKSAKADGNTVVMITRRDDTPENQKTVADTLGDYAGAFSNVLLIGKDTLKEAGAKAAGINVDVWIDDSPQFIRQEEKPKRTRRAKTDGEV